MRWFSHRSRTWKDTVLKIKIKKKTEGFTLVATALAVLCWIFIAQAFFMMSSGTLSTVKAERTAYQAEQNTALDVSRLKALDYDDLDSKGAHARKVIEGVGDGNWESEVTIDPEQPLNGGDDDAKLRIAHVKVYRTGDTTSRYSLDVPLTSQYGDGGNRGIGDYIPVDYTGTAPEDGFLLFNRHNGGYPTTYLCINPDKEKVCFSYTGDGAYGGSDHTYLVPIKKGSEWVFSGDLSPIHKRLWFISFKKGVNPNAKKAHL